MSWQEKNDKRLAELADEHVHKWFWNRKDQEWKCYRCKTWKVEDSPDMGPPGPPPAVDDPYCHSLNELVDYAYKYGLLPVYQYTPTICKELTNDAVEVRLFDMEKKVMLHIKESICITNLLSEAKRQVLSDAIIKALEAKK